MISEPDHVFNKHHHVVLNRATSWKYHTHNTCGQTDTLELNEK